MEKSVTQWSRRVFFNRLTNVRELLPFRLVTACFHAGVHLPQNLSNPLGPAQKADSLRDHPEAYATGRPCQSLVPFFPSRKPPTVVGTKKTLEWNPPNARSRQQLPSEKTGRPGVGSASDKTKKLAPQTTRSSDSFCFPDPQRLLCLPRP